MESFHSEHESLRWTVPLVLTELKRDPGAHNRQKLKIGFSWISSKRENCVSALRIFLRLTECFCSILKNLNKIAEEYELQDITPFIIFCVFDFECFA